MPLWIASTPLSPDYEKLARVMWKQLLESCSPPLRAPPASGQPAGRAASAEIEGAIQDALYDAYADGRREVTTEDILATLAATISIAVTMREPIEAMRRWAPTRARRASAPEEGAG
jgi:hypothetical protein